MVNVCYSLRAEVGIKVIFFGRVGEKPGGEDAGHLIFGNWEVEGGVLSIFGAQCPRSPNKAGAI